MSRKKLPRKSPLINNFKNMKTKKTVSDIYWDNEIEECKKHNRLVKKEVLIDNLVSWSLVLSVSLLLTLIFIK